MSRGPLRRTMIFVDYSALRDTLRRNAWLTDDAGPHPEIDFAKLGQRLTPPGGEFIRLNLHTATPVDVDERDGGIYMHGLAVHDHEAHRAGILRRAFQDLVRQVDSRSPFTELHCGRMVLRRVQLKHGPAFEWAQGLLAGAGEGDEAGKFFDEAVRLNSEAKAAREELARRIVALKDAGRIPPELMPSYSRRLGELLDEQLDFSEKGVDTRLAVQMYEQCLHDAFDDAVLFAADEDYIPLVEAVKRTGRRVIHAFWDVHNMGFQLQKACDDSLLLGKDDLAELV